MKRLLFAFTLLFFLLACNKEKKYTQYKMIMKYDSLTIDGTYLPHIANDTIMGYSDNNAYLNAYIKYDADRFSPIKIHRNNSFVILDKNNIDLTVKLPVKYIDSVHRIVDKICENELKNPAPKKIEKENIHLSDQNKVIGGIEFGMTKKKVSRLIKKLEHATEKSPFRYSIGNYEYFQVYGDYYKEKLYMLTFNGLILNNEYNSTGREQINAIINVLKNKYGKPQRDNPIPEEFQMQNGYTHLIDAWTIGNKTIEVKIQDNGASFFSLVDFYQTDIKDVIDSKELRTKDSLSKAAKELFK